MGRVLDAHSLRIEILTKADRLRVKQTGGTTTVTKESEHEQRGSGSGDSAEGNTSRLNSMRSDEPADDSNKHWRTPKTVREFAAQVNHVATMVLNDEIDPDKARIYNSSARVVAQSLSSDVTRSRFLKEEPNMSLDEDVFEDGPGSGEDLTEN
jgi:hypothetical protein